MEVVEAMTPLYSLVCAVSGYLLLSGFKPWCRFRYSPKYVRVEDRK